MLIGALGDDLKIKPDSLRVLLPFFTLQDEHAVTRFVHVSLPPLDFGFT
jgi:hypothetical protein